MGEMGLGGMRAGKGEAEEKRAAVAAQVARVDLEGWVAGGLAGEVVKGVQGMGAGSPRGAAWAAWAALGEGEATLGAVEARVGARAGEGEAGARKVD